MTEKVSYCRRCFLLESGKVDIKTEVERLISELPEWKRASESEYKNRLSVCKTCAHLLAGTCFKCGCYVEYRAAEVNNSCPLDKWKI